MNKLLAQALKKLLFMKIYITEDLRKAERSIFQYKMLPRSEARHRFYLSVLGVINGILPKFKNKVLFHTQFITRNSLH